MCMSANSIWYTRCPVPSPLGLAARFGWLDEAFGRYGIDVQSIGDSRDPLVRESHFNHTLRWSFRQGGNIPAIRARSDGRETRLIGLTWVDEYQAIITLPGSRLRSIDDLPGRRIGIPRRAGNIVDFHRATALKGVVSALSLIGRSIEAATLVDVAIEESIITHKGDPGLHGLARRHPYWHEIAALARGDVDAIFVKGAEGVTISNLLSAAVVVETGHHPDPKVRINNGTPRTLTVDASFIEERPDLAVELVTQVHRASDWAHQHPAETLRFVAQEVLTSEEAAASAYGDAHLKLGLGLPPEQVAAIDHFKDFLLSFGFLEKDFDVNAWVDRRPLEGVFKAAAE
ncbi:ABC transporter substrate-binding protein [Bradyrhizobium sp. 61]|nr:ABC transporter substrate-binding protein [Bradyrhizobium sp. 61]MCK1441700.1 ABC transporter substrate-binding protein [Bradyrhizobium sp. 48]MCK1465242.1 ABC transporter substrate-binding protein [Bradyrhizobium sp. 2]